jgi:hypothetical protein
MTNIKTGSDYSSENQSSLFFKTQKSEKKKLKYILAEA